MPVRAAREWCERFEREVEREDQRWEEEEEEEEEEGTGLDLHALRMQRERDVRDTWGRGLEGLSALKTVSGFRRSLAACLILVVADAVCVSRLCRERWRSWRGQRRRLTMWNLWSLDEKGF